MYQPVSRSLILADGYSSEFPKLLVLILLYVIKFLLYFWKTKFEIKKNYPIETKYEVIVSNK